MKKIVLLLLVLPVMAAAAFAQESRQDVSVSGSAMFSPEKVANAVDQTATIGIGGLASYRFMLTPRSALEANYQYLQRSDKYVNSFNTLRVHERVQEYTAGYVFSFNYRNFNPFLEGGGGGYFFRPILDNKTTSLSAKGSTNIGGFYGGGIAYELSPSFDIRVEYRGIIIKTPDLTGETSTNGTHPFAVSRYYNINDPVIGVAYHF